MSEVQMQQFDQRVRRIEGRHRKMSRGIELSVSKDGLVVARPTRDIARFPLRALLILLAGLMAFKGLVHAQIGAEVYNERVLSLSNGTAIEQAGAWFMHADPITLWLSAQFVGLTF